MSIQSGSVPLAVAPWRRIAGDVRLAAIVALARVRSITRRRRARRDPQLRRVALGEVIVAYPEQVWEEARNASVLAAIDLVERRMRRWEVGVRGSRSVDRGRLRGLSRTYLRVGVEVGFEDDVVRAIRIAAWRQGLKGGRFGVLVVRSPLIASATSAGPPGLIQFTDAYTAAKEAVGATHADAKGVTILVIDVDRPDLAYLPEIADRVQVLDDDTGPIRDGHATLMTAVVADIAPGATIKTLSIGDLDGSASPFALFGALLDEHEAHVIVASVMAPEGTKKKDSKGREALFETALRSRMYQPSRPPLFCPTGNHDPNGREKINTLAFPSRFETVAAIGAVTGDFARAAGSRYGEKHGEDRNCWWVAPGGSFDGSVITEPLAYIGDRPQAGTSIANAIAGALAAVAIRRLQDVTGPSDPAFVRAIRHLKEDLGSQPRSAESLELAQALEEQHTGAVTFGRLVEALTGMAHSDWIQVYDPWEHGRGLLRLG